MCADGNNHFLNFNTPMCVQDPFKLCVNVASNVSKIELLKFQKNCVDAAKLLQ